MAETLGKFLGPAAAVLQFIAIWLPKADSAELAYMKKSFSKVFDSLQAIEGKLDSLSSLVKWESQKAIYVKDIQKINYGYRELNRLMDIMVKAYCTTKNSCKRKKLKVASMFYRRGVFDTGRNVYNILDGMLTKGSAVVSYIPGLLAEQSKCDIPKLEVCNSN